MSKIHLKKGDEVVVISGSAKGRRGKVQRVLIKKESVVLEAADPGAKSKEGAEKESNQDQERSKLIKPIRHYLKPTEAARQGGMLWLEGPIHASNVMLASRYDARKGAAK